MFEKIKQLKDLRDQAKLLKDRLAAVTVTADALGGKITVVMDGNQEIVAIDIDPSLMTGEQRETVQRELRNAINEAGKKAKQEMGKQFQQGGLSLPNFGG